MCVSFKPCTSREDRNFQEMSSPKARLHLLYLKCETQPRYETVPAASQGSSDNSVVASAAFYVKSSCSQQSGFRCTLYLPDCPAVVSDVFPKKKEAEQDAAKKALEQMGKSFSMGDDASKSQSNEEKMTALVERVGAIFSERVVMNCQPLKEHFRSAMRRKDRKYGLVPAAALAALDNKIVSLCKLLHSSTDSNPAFAMAMVWEAAKICQSVTCEQGFWIKRIDPFSTGFEEEFLNSSAQVEFCSKFEAVYIPCSCNEMVTNIEIKLEAHEYYMDALSSNLGIKDGAGIMMSRAIPRAPHGTRLYWPVPEILPAFSLPQGDSLPEFSDNRYIMSEKGDCILESSEKTCLELNKRASKLVGFPVYGGAILASVGSSWKSEGRLSCVDLSLSCYYRLLLARVPEGNYKISRDAILVAKLPCSFSSRSQWRGKLPRTLLMDFCQQHRLPDPVFSFSCSKMAGDNSLDDEEKTSSSNNPYHCRVKLLYSGKDIEFESEHLYRNRIDAVQSAALRALLFLSKSADALDTPQLAEVCEGQVARLNGCHKGGESVLIMEDFSANGQLEKTIQVAESASGQSCKGVNGGSNSTKAIPSGSIVSIAYDVWLFGNGPILKLEAQNDFEFELGIGGVIGQLDSLVSGMHIGDFGHFFLPLPSLHLVLAARGDVIGKHTEFDIGCCLLRYDVRVLKSVEPPEERMESALFSPPLSKQRNEFSIRKLQEIHAKSLVDLGCGSGSLLDAVLDHSTELEYIAGVDISLKSLIRASKSLHTKLGTHTEQHIGSGCKELKQAVLYEGSLAEPDSRLCGFDVATCIEVIEHMDPEPLSKAGEIILGTLSPRMLILSTPNIEYNVVLQKMTVDAKLNMGHCKSDNFNTAGKSSSPTVVNELNRVSVSESHTEGPAASPGLDKLVPVEPKSTLLFGEENGPRPSPLHILDDDDDGVRLFESGKGHDLESLALVDDSHSATLFDDEIGSQAIKLRNEDHRFEWTRAEFMEWADNLASRFDYTVEYTGVGGSEEDPGFASQIAIFTRKHCQHGVKARSEMDDFVDGGLCSICNFKGRQGGHSFPYREVWKYDKDGIPMNIY